MRKIDYHLHTYFSADSQANPEEHILKAIQEGLEEICFTDHNDFIDGWRLQDIDSYLKELFALKEKYSDLWDYLLDNHLILKRLDSIGQAFSDFWSCDIKSILSHAAPG